MLISYRWLKELCPTGMAPDQLAHGLTMQGNAVDDLKVEFDVILGQLAQVTHDGLAIRSWWAMPSVVQGLCLGAVEVRKLSQVQSGDGLIFVHERVEKLLKVFRHGCRAAQWGREIGLMKSWKLT